MPGAKTTNYKYFVTAIDLGGTSLRAANVDESGAIHRRLVTQTPRSDRADEVVAAILAAARECERALAPDATLSAISVAVPGTVNQTEGVVICAPNLPALNGLALSDIISNALGRPVVLENDANAAAVGEMWRGAGRGHKTIVCVTLGTGVGGGIILDGKLWRGADGSAGEIGHMCVNPLGEIMCSCGGHDCLEMYASATAIVRMTRESRPHWPDSAVASNEELSAEEIYRAGMSGDPLALEVFKIMGKYLGAGLVNVIALINPDVIIIGGAVAGAWELFAPHMLREVRSRKFPMPAAQVKVVKAECGDDAGVLGVAHLAFGVR